MGRRKINLDTALFATLSSAERSTHTEFEEMFSRAGQETELNENPDGSEMELQPRGKNIGN